MEKKPLYADADPDDTRPQPVPPPPVPVSHTDISQYVGWLQHRIDLSIYGRSFFFQSWYGRVTARARSVTAQVFSSRVAAPLVTSSPKPPVLKP